MAIARDKFWLFGVRAHQDDVWLGPAGPDSNRKFFYSRITPAEGAFILDVPNLVMVICDGEPANFSHDAYGYAESFCRLKNVQWSCSGSGGFRSGNEEEFVCRLAEEYPNICGAYLDDFIDEPYIRAAGDDRQELHGAPSSGWRRFLVSWPKQPVLWICTAYTTPMCTAIWILLFLRR